MKGPRFWNKSKRLPPGKKEPREMAAINTEYTQTCAQIGLKQVGIKQLEQEVGMLVYKVGELKEEGKRRQELDNKKAEQEKELESAKAGVQQAGAENSNPGA